MTTISLRKLALAAALAPLALGLAACKQDASAPGAPSGEAIAKIAAPAGKAWSDVVSQTADGGYVMGNPEAPIKVIEFGSLTCSHCAEFAEASDAEMRDTFVASGRVSFEFRNFIRDGLDVTMAQLTRCGAPESFFALTHQAFSNQKALFEKVQANGAAVESAMNAPVAQRGLAVADAAGLLEFFAARGISRDQAATCLADTAQTTKLVDQTQKYGQQYPIEGTPTFIVNGTKFNGGTWPELKAELERLGAR